MKTFNEKEEKLNSALKKLKNLKFENPELKEHTKNLSNQKNQLEIEKKEIEERYQSLVTDYKVLSQKLEEINNQKIDARKKEI